MIEERRSCIDRLFCFSFVNMRGLATIIYVIGLIFGTISCSPCRNLECDNGGYCQDGECLCLKWYSGESCQLMYNRHFEGVYIGQIDSSSRTIQSSLEILSDDEIPNRINVSETGVFLEFSNDSQLVIPTQLIVHQLDTIAISGEGTFKDEELSFHYSREFAQSRSYLFQFTGRKYDLAIE